jgi:P-type Mg2+ transporter
MWSVKITTLAIVAIGAILPVTPLAGALGFTPLPLAYYLFLVGVTVIVTYLLLVHVSSDA